MFPVPPRRRFDPAAIDDLARAQGGLITFGQLRSLDMSAATISRWTRTGGRWQRLLPAVYLVHRGSPTADERLHAARLYARDSSMFTGAAALHLYGLRSVPTPLAAERIHALIPARQQTQSSGFVLLERTTRLPRAVVRGGFPVAPLPRALFDAGRRTTDKQSTRGFVLEAIQRRLVTMDDLRDEIAAGPRQWTALLRDVLGEGQAGVRSEPEAGLRSLIRRSGIEEPLWNPRLETPAGVFIAEPDGYFRNRALALEVDSRRYHFSNSDHYEQTWRRHARYTAHGIAVLRIIPVDISRRPGEVIDSVRAALLSQAGRPVPDLRIVPARS